MKRCLSLLLLVCCFFAGCNRNEHMTHTEATVSLGTVAPSAPTQPPATTAPSVDPVKEYLKGMSLEEKIGQLFIVAPEQFLQKYSAVTTMTDGLKAGLVQYPVGGIILFAENIQSPSQLKELTTEFQKAAAHPLFMAVDEEPDWRKMTASTSQNMKALQQ